MTESRDDRIDQYLTPSVEDQTILVLEGKCPHNKGWNYAGHSHNDDAYRCNLCGQVEFY